MKPIAAAAAAVVGLLTVVLLVGGAPLQSTSDDGVDPSRLGTAAGAAQEEILLAPPRSDAFTAAQVVESLPSPGVLRFRVVDFEPYDRATARQCRLVDGADVCGNEIPVQFDDSGRAVFQYQVVDEFLLDDDSPGCGVGDPPCRVVVSSLDQRRRAEVLTVFGSALPPPGQVTVEPHDRLEDRQVVAIRVTGLAADTAVRVTTCVAPSTSDPRRCGAPAPVAAMRTGADGSGETELETTRGPIGTQRLRCDREHRCAIVVLADRTDVRAEPADIAFAPLPGATYDPARLGVGLGIAVLLLGLAAGLVMRTDWSPVGEAAAPEIDDAVYADLDAMVAAMPPETDIET